MPDSETILLGVYNLPVFNTSTHIVQKVIKHFVELGDNFLKFHSATEGIVYQGEEWEFDRRNWRCTVRRDRIAGVSMYYSKWEVGVDFYEEETDLAKSAWVIEVEISGCRDEVIFKYPDTEGGLIKARSMFAILETWHLDTVS